MAHVEFQYIGEKKITDNENIEAPRINNDRHKISWSETGSLEYQSLVSPALSSLRENWLDPSSSSSISILISTTNKILSNAAQATNKTIFLNKDTKAKSTHVPAEIKQASEVLNKTHKAWLKITESPHSSTNDKRLAKSNFQEARKMHTQNK